MANPIAPLSPRFDEAPENLLEKAWEIAEPGSRPATQTPYVPVSRKVITRRGIFWAGQTCNLRCHFCYYLDRITDSAHPEHAFMTLEKAQKIARVLTDFYGNNSFDIQGGEPTLWKHIVAYVRFCKSIGLDATIITNAQALDSRDRVLQYKEAGVRDFLVSVQALGPAYDEIVGRRGAHVRQMKALRNMQEVGIPFRFNTVMSKAAVPQLAEIAELGVRAGAKVVNYLAFNPFDDQRNEGRASTANVATYTEAGESVSRALDVLADAGVEGNVRYLPLCMVPPRHRKSAYSFRTLSYDVHENDFASWAWTGQQPQRMRGGELTSPPVMGPRMRLGPLRRTLRVLGRKPRIGPYLHRAKWRLDYHCASLFNRMRPGRAREKLYAAESVLRSKEHCDYVYPEVCRQCDARAVCDGFHGSYAAAFGTAEARPIKLGKEITDPKHFLQHQIKSVHPNDIAWIEGTD